MTEISKGIGTKDIKSSTRCTFEVIHYIIIVC